MDSRKMLGWILEKCLVGRQERFSAGTSVWPLGVAHVNQSLAVVMVITVSVVLFGQALRKNNP